MEKLPLFDVGLCQQRMVMLNKLISLGVLFAATICLAQNAAPGSAPYPGSYNNGQPANNNYNNTPGNYNNGQAGSYNNGQPGNYNNQPGSYNNGQPGNYNNAPAGNYNNSQPGNYNRNPASVYNQNSGNYPTGNTGYNTQPGGILFSNQAGQAYSTHDLAFQLQNLRSAIDQALPALSAFNESYSNMNNGGKQTVGGALSGIVSDVLHRNQGQTGAGQSLTTSNLLSALQGVLHPNNSTSTSNSTPNPQDLIALQNDLQPVISVLERLNVNPSFNRGSTPYPNSGVTPTGR